MVIIQLTSEQFTQAIQSAVRKVLAENSLKEYPKDENERPKTVSEISEYLNLAEQTIYGLVSKRMIPYNKKGKRLYFLKAEIDTWIASGRKKTVEEIRKEVGHG